MQHPVQFAVCCRLECSPTDRTPIVIHSFLSQKLFSLYRVINIRQVTQKKTKEFFISCVKGSCVKESHTKLIFFPHQSYLKSVYRTRDELRVGYFGIH